MKKLVAKLVVPITIGAMLLGLFGCNETEENKINRDVNFGEEMSWVQNNRTEIAGQVVAARALPNTGYVLLVPTYHNFQDRGPGAIGRLATNLEYVVAADPAEQTRVDGTIGISYDTPAADSARLAAIGATVVRRP